MKYFPLTRAPILAFSSPRLACTSPLSLYDLCRGEELKSLFTGISARITISLRRKACMHVYYRRRQALNKWITQKSLRRTQKNSRSGSATIINFNIWMLSEWCHWRRAKSLDLNLNFTRTMNSYSHCMMCVICRILDSDACCESHHIYTPRKGETDEKVNTLFFDGCVLRNNNWAVTKVFCVLCNFRTCADSAISRS